MSNLEKAEENTFQKIKKVDDKNIDIMLDKEFLPIGLDLSGSFFDWKKEESFKGILRKHKTLFDFVDKRGEAKNLPVLEFTIKKDGKTQNILVANTLLVGNIEDAAKEIHEANFLEFPDKPTSFLVNYYVSGIPFIITKTGESEGKNGTYYTFSIEPAILE